VNLELIDLVNRCERIEIQYVRTEMSLLNDLRGKMGAVIIFRNLLESGKDSEMIYVT
jgi:hypothetical protein